MLTADQLAHFHDQGWLVIKNLVDAATVARLQEETDALHERMAAHTPAGVGVAWEDHQDPSRPKRIRQLMHSEKVCPTIEQILTSDAMLDVVEALIGPRIILYHSKLMMKAATDGTFTPWHQDYGYWHYSSKTPSQVNGMLAIDPQHVENGCIRFVPGSHKGGLVDHRRFQSSSFNIGLSDQLDDYPAAIPVEFEPGDAIFFGSLVIHGSAPNTSPMHRRANTFAFDIIGNWLKDEHNATERILRDRAHTPA